MARLGFASGLPLGSQPDLVVSGDEALAYRVRQLLSSKPGDIPWLPQFGVDLRALVGESATGVTIELVRSRITQAVERWLPEVAVEGCEVTVQARQTPGFKPHGPIERALVPLGAQATLSVTLSLSSDGKTVQLQVGLQP